MIDAHPGAQYFLILFGTNDSGVSTPLLPNGVLSGAGEISPDPGTFKYNMQLIIDAVVAGGKTPILAKVPIALGASPIGPTFPNPDTASRNLLIQEYNQAIDELVSTNGTAVTGPDLYALFNRRSSRGKRYDL